MQRMFCFLMVSPLFGPVIKTTFKSSVSINNVVVVVPTPPLSQHFTQPLRRSDETLVLGPRRTQRITGSAFWFFFFQPNWQIDNGYFNRPVMALTQILVHSWRPRTKISVLARRRTYQRFGFVCGDGYGCRHRRDIFYFPIIAFETFWPLL